MLNKKRYAPLNTYRVVPKSGHPRNSIGVRFFGPPCMPDIPKPKKDWKHNIKSLQ